MNLFPMASCVRKSRAFSKSVKKTTNILHSPTVSCREKREKERVFKMERLIFN